MVVVTRCMGAIKIIDQFEKWVVFGVWPKIFNQMQLKTSLDKTLKAFRWVIVE